MDPLDTLKKIREIIKKSNDHELANLILDLQNDVFAIENHNLVLSSELVNLKRQLAALGRMRKRLLSRRRRCAFLSEMLGKLWESNSFARTRTVGR
jgi:hypothetical protein